MFELIFTALMIAVFGKLLSVSIRMTWSMVRVVFVLILLPFILLFGVIKGLIKIALPVLIIIGAVTFLSELLKK